MKVLVFGAGGYIGRHLSAGLRHAQFEVTTAGTHDGAAMDAISGRISENFAVAPGTDAVVYLSQSPHWRDQAARFDHVLAVNCGAAVRLAHLALRAGVRKFLYASTGTVYQPANMPLTEDAALNRKDWYGLSKILAEEALGNLPASLQVNCLRLFGVYGPRQDGRLVANLARRIWAGQPITLDTDPSTGRADGLRSTMTHIDDLVDVLAQLLRAESLAPVLNVASDQAASIREIAAILGRQLERPVIFHETGHSLAGHFIADVSRMRHLVQHQFQPVEEGLLSLKGTLGLESA